MYFFIQDIFSNFIVPSFAYFFIFSLFETRLIVMIWKAHYFPGSQLNQDQLRTQLVRFYSRFCTLLTRHPPDHQLDPDLQLLPQQLLPNPSQPLHGASDCAPSL